jgi:hypothetical protein
MRNSGEARAFVRAVADLPRPSSGIVGRLHLVRDDLALSRVLFKVIKTYRELEPGTQDRLSTTFRFVPLGLSGDRDAVEAYLDRLNATMLDRLKQIGGAFLFEAVVDGKYVLRACIVNFRVTLADVEALPEMVTRLGRQVDRELRKRVPGVA